MVVRRKIIGKSQENKNISFDNEKYLAEQTKAILERVKQFNNKLYLEFGGKLGYDYHAARVLPGYDSDVKLKLLRRLKNKVEIILCIYADDIARGKVRGDFAITYDFATLKLIDDLKKWGLDKVTVLITRFKGEPAVIKFKNKLEKRKIKIYIHKEIKNYPSDVDFAVSKNGFGKNCYIPTRRPIVVVNGPGPNSGKMATCLSQLYHDHKRGKKSGYAKFETFPIWNLPLEHMANVAYEAATADIGDYNVVDPFHLKAYGKTTVNYNRDVENFPILKKLLEKIVGDDKELPYQSPTDMGVNRAGFAIINDEAIRRASRQELVRRYFRYNCEYICGAEKKETVERVEKLLGENDIKISERKAVEIARKIGKEAFAQGRGHKGISCGAAIELKDGKIITALNSKLMHAASALIIEVLKVLGGIPETAPLVPVNFFKKISSAKTGILNSDSRSLDLNEVLMALIIYSNANPKVKSALDNLKQIKGCEMHMTHMPTPGDEVALKKIGINLTCDPNFSSRNLFIV
ncbi:MAG: DUF1846 family protein [Patescibacteria group bacterium]|nr:DUF1846 family protein [Patescibacteria group bacterium]